MAFIYILFIFLFIILAVYFLNKRQAIKDRSNELNVYKDKIIEINNQLDMIHETSEELNVLFDKINKVSSHLIKYRKKY